MSISLPFRNRNARADRDAVRQDWIDERRREAALLWPMLSIIPTTCCAWPARFWSSTGRRQRNARMRESC